MIQKMFQEIILTNNNFNNVFQQNGASGLYIQLNHIIHISIPL